MCPSPREGIDAHRMYLVAFMTGILLWMWLPTSATSLATIHHGGRSLQQKILRSTLHRAIPESGDFVKVDSISSEQNPYLPLWKLASAHCASQALRTLVQLRIPDLLGNDTRSMQEIAQAVGTSNEQTCDLLRILRVLTTVGVLEEVIEPDEITGESMIHFSLTSSGHLLKSDAKNGMAAGIQHWMEAPLWNSWLEVPSYLQQGPPLPFERANEGISSDFYYNANDHPESLQLANDFVRWIHEQEVDAVVNGFDWASLRKNGSLGSKESQNKAKQHPKLVDIGGHHGTVAAAIAAQYPEISVYSLDLPQVIESAPDPSPKGVSLIPGDVLDESTLPSCDAILLKHFLDRCMWSEDQSVQILKSCYAGLLPKGTLVIADAVLPNVGDENTQGEAESLSLCMDAMYMMVGREGQRTLQEWNQLAGLSGFQIELMDINATTCTLLEKIAEVTISDAPSGVKFEMEASFV